MKRMSAQKEKQLEKLLAQNLTKEVIARRLEVSRVTVYNAKRRLEQERQSKIVCESAQKSE